MKVIENFCLRLKFKCPIRQTLAVYAVCNASNMTFKKSPKIHFTVAVCLVDTLPVPQEVFGRRVLQQ